MASDWLIIAGNCKRFNQLPRPGGMMMQYPKEMAIVMGMCKVLDDWEDEEMKKSSKAHEAQNRFRNR